jgi:hypothetical protein
MDKKNLVRLTEQESLSLKALVSNGEAAAYKPKERLYVDDPGAEKAVLV